MRRFKAGLYLFVLLFAFVSIAEPQDKMAVKCRNLWETAFDEVQDGSNEWDNLIDFYAACLMEEHREAEAVNLLQEAIEISPKNFRFLAQIGTAYLRMKDYENAEKYFFQSIAVIPNRDAYYRLALIHLTWGAAISDNMKKRQELLTKAENEILKTIKLFRTDKRHASPYSRVTYLSLLAEIYAAQCDWEKSEDIYREIINEVETSKNWDTKRRRFALCEFKFSLGQKLFIKGEKEEGIMLMEEAIDIAPTENLKTIKRQLLDLTINAPRVKEGLEKHIKAKYPHLKPDQFIPLY
jgi:tetratricopeptide (TPR) repeat protein